MTPPDSSRAPRLVLTTAPDLDVGRRLARLLVDARLAACVNLVPGAVSLFRWEDQVQEQAEVLVVCKTTTDCLVALEAKLLAAHPYDCPELVVIAPEAVEPAYLAWLLASVGPA